MLRKKSKGLARSTNISRALAGVTGGAVDRRTFLRNSGLAAGGIAAGSLLTGGMVKKAEAAAGGADIEIKKSVCTHCSVGCSVIAEVQKGTWIGQEPGFDSPFNLGAHLRQGRLGSRTSDRREAAAHADETGRRQVQGGQWEDAINEIGDKMLKIREESGPDSVYWLGSAKHNNEQAYLFRKFMPSGARTTATIRPVSVIRPRSRVLRTPGAMAR